MPLFFGVRRWGVSCASPQLANQRLEREGYRYAPKSTSGRKTSERLVPFHFLDDNEWALDRARAIDFVRSVWVLGYEIRIRAGVAAPETLNRSVESMVPVVTAQLASRVPASLRLTRIDSFVPVGRGVSRRGRVATEGGVMDAAVAGPLAGMALMGAVGRRKGPAEQKRMVELEQFKQGLMNAYLFAVAR